VPQAAILEMSRESTRRRLTVLNQHWLGHDPKFLCGDQITIADYFGGCLVSLGETIKVDDS
jgi:glutathione S-transferase